MAMNREFLEALYEENRVAAEHLEKLQGEQTFCAEACQECKRTINSNEPAHCARTSESEDRAAMLAHLLDLYWQAHNH